MESRFQAESLSPRISELNLCCLILQQPPQPAQTFPEWFISQVSLNWGGWLKSVWCLGCLSCSAFSSLGNISRGRKVPNSDGKNLLWLFFPWTGWGESGYFSCITPVSVLQDHCHPDFLFKNLQNPQVWNKAAHPGDVCAHLQVPSS